MPPESGTRFKPIEGNELTAVATRLIGRGPVAIASVGGGGNNRIFRANADAENYALKVYPRQHADRRDRLAVEFNTLTFLTRHGIDCVPQPLASDPTSGCALYQWVSGERIDHPTTGDIDAALILVSDLHKLRTARESADLKGASAACLSPGEAIRQAERRLGRLRSVAEAGSPLVDLVADAERQLATLSAAADEGLRARGIDPNTDLTPTKRCLSPSDFGFHNALRRPDGSIIFVDFEYFGWDDPVKMTADFMLHAGMDLPSDLAVRFRDGVLDIFADDEELSVRLHYLLPVYALQWIAIVLNEFLPEHWERRAYAGANNGDKIRTRQLSRARQRLAMLPNLDGYR